MYDTVKFYLDNDFVDMSILDSVCKYEESPLNKQGNEYHRLTYKGLNVIVGTVNTYINGSICKYYYDSNQRPLQRKTTEKAIEQLSNELGFDPAKAKVTRLDIGKNFIMNRTIGAYVPLFAESVNYTRSIDRGTLYYNQTEKVKVLYDKNKETLNSKHEQFFIFKDQNVLRYELRLMKKVSNKLNYEATLKNLYEQEFYMRCVDLWVKEYQSIQKARNMNIDFTKVRTQTDLDKVFQMLGIEYLGGREKALELLESCSPSNDKSMKRMRSRIRELTNNPIHSEIAEEIKELDHKIADSVKYYR